MSQFSLGNIGRTPRDQVRTRRLAQRTSQAKIDFGTGFTVDQNGDVAVDLPALVSSNETPVGVIDGVNPTFTLSDAAVAGSLAVYLSGVYMSLVVDYTQPTTTTIEFDAAQIPQTGDVLTVSYIKDV